MNGDQEKGQSAFWGLQQRTRPLRAQQGEEQTLLLGKGRPGQGSEFSLERRFSLVRRWRLRMWNACAGVRACTCVDGGEGGRGGPPGPWLPAAPFRVTLPGPPFLLPGPLTRLSPKLCNTWQ